MNDSVFKILRCEEWQALKTHKIFSGSPHDLRDGFIHLCAPHQLAGTLAKHFSKVSNIVLARFDIDQLEGVKWEVSRDGEKFPHIYGTLPLCALQDHMNLQANMQGIFDIPTDFLGRL